MTTKKKDFWAGKSLMTEEEVNEYAIGIFRTGRWYYIKPENLENQAAIFVIMGAFQKYTKQSIGKIGAILGDMDKTFSRCINGLPMFQVIQPVHEDDWAKIVEKVKKLEEAEKVALET